MVDAVTLAASSCVYSLVQVRLRPLDDRLDGSSIPPLSLPSYQSLRIQSLCNGAIREPARPIAPLPAKSPNPVQDLCLTGTVSKRLPTNLGFLRESSCV